MKSILIISFSPIRRDPRVMRQVRLLARDFKVTVAGFEPGPQADVEFVSLLASRPADISPSLKRFAKRILGQFDPRRIPRMLELLTGRFERFHWGSLMVRMLLDAFAGRRFDLVLANDIKALPAALRIADGAPVLFDAHEYSPREFEDRWLWRLLEGRYYTYLCRKYLPQVACMTTVGTAIADEYRMHFGVEPVVIRNSLPRQSLPVGSVAPDTIRMIHHGIASRSRHLHLMIDAMKQLDERFRLDLMLMIGDAAYHAELRERAAGDPRIRFVDPVAMDDICATLNPYDLGIAFFPSVNFNYANCLPNKFFEFIQGRLAIAVGPSPEMADIVRSRDIGVVAASFEAADLARALATLTVADVRRFKENADAAAEALSFETDGARLRGLIDQLLEERVSCAV